MKKTLKIKNGNSVDVIKQLGNLDKLKDYRVTIELWDYKRSVSQNKRYWDLLGNKNNILDQEITVIPSTTTLTVKEFSKYMSDIESFAKSLGFKRKIDFQDFQDG